MGEKMAKAGARAWLFGCGGLLLLGCAGLGTLALQVVDFPVVAMRADKAATDYRAAGLPWRAEDVKRKVDRADNADPKFLAEMGTRQSWPVGGTNDIQDAMSRYDYQAAAAGLKSLKTEIAKFERASKAKAISFDKDWDEGAYVLFPEFAKFKAAVKLLTWRAEVKAKSGDLDGALTDLRTAYRIGSLVGQEPSLIGVLVGIACHAIAVRGAEYVAALHPTDTAWIRRVRAEEATWKSDFTLDAAMRGDMYMELACIRNLRDQDIYMLGSNEEYGSIGPSEGKLVREGFGRGTVRRAYQTRLMEVWLEMDRIYRKSPDVVAGSEAMDEYIEKLSSSGKMSDRPLLILFPVFGSAGFAVAKDRVLTQMSDAALRAAEVKAREGSFPQTWEELGGAKVIDPATGEPMKMKLVNGVFYIYSVGKNKVDDGAIDASGMRQGDDFAVSFPPKRRTATSTSSSAKPYGLQAPPPPPPPGVK